MVKKGDIVYFVTEFGTVFERIQQIRIMQNCQVFMPVTEFGTVFERIQQIRIMQNCQAFMPVNMRQNSEGGKERGKKRYFVFYRSCFCDEYSCWDEYLSGCDL